MVAVALIILMQRRSISPPPMSEPLAPASITSVEKIVEAVKAIV